MIKIADLISTLSEYLEAKRELEKCRGIATGDVEYYCYSYHRDLEHAEQALETALNGYIHQRIAEDVRQPDTLAA